VDLHFEVELALVMGKRVKDLEASDEKGALDAIGCKSNRFRGPETLSGKGRSLS
jgi:hypothetical protein